MRPLVVVNPRAAGGRSGRTFPRLREILERRLGPTDVVATEGVGHATRIARGATREGRALVIAVGGDGTLHEVANGVLAERGETAVGYVGQGSGGDFRKTLGIDHRLDAYLDVLAGGRDTPIDVGRASFCDPEGRPAERWFVNILSAGMGGLVDRYVASTTKALGGQAAYLWASARALAASRRGRLRCTSELGGERQVHELDSYMIAICNGRYFGGGMHVAPMARLDDGRFEVVSMDAPGKLAFAGFSRRIYDASHLRAPGVRHFACDRLSLELRNDEARDVFLLDVDGEPLGGLPLEVEVVPRALRVRVAK